MEKLLLLKTKVLISIKTFSCSKTRPCVFEYIYFARPDSLIKNKCAYEYRKVSWHSISKKRNRY